MLIFVLSLAGHAHGEPLVRVRAESRIELGVVHIDLGISITGALRDELGNVLAGRPLAIEAASVEESDAPFRSQITTDANGRFTLELPDGGHDYRLLATFAGDATHRGVRVERRVERARADVRLELRLPSESTLDLDAPDLYVEALAESDGGGEALSMRLTDETGRVIASGVTSADGHLLLRIPTDSGLEPGPGLLRLESARDERRAEAQTEARIVRRRAVFVALEPVGTHFEAGSQISVRGKVSTRVKPRAQVPVGLFAGTRHLETVLTDDAGNFQAALWIDAPAGPLSLTARTEADSTGAYPAAVSELVLDISPLSPVPLRWVLGVCAAMALLLYVVARSKKSASLSEVSPDAKTESRGTSIRLAPRHGRKDRHRIHGKISEARSDRPVAGAQIQIVHEQPAASCALQPDPHGRFASPVLPAGRAQLLVSFPGYVSAQVNFEIPHRGEWTSFEVKLESLRDRALSPFRRLTMRVLPSARAWGIWTNREARTWLGQRTPAHKELLSELTLNVERACYGQTPPSETDVLDIERASRAIEADLTRESPRDSSLETRTVR